MNHNVEEIIQTKKGEVSKGVVGEGGDDISCNGKLVHEILGLVRLYVDYCFESMTNIVH